jgi:hypothetical protein
MGPQQVLRAAGVLAALAIGAFGSVARADDQPDKAAAVDARKPTHERIAIVDLGPNAADATTRQKLAAAATDAGLDPAVGDDGIDAALAGQTADLDQPQLTDAIDRATKAFAALDCKTAVPAATLAIGLMAARQADGFPVPELARAYAYQLLCADRTNDSDTAMRAASRLRVVGAPPDVAPLLTKYPELDSSADRELVEVEVTADVPDAMIWIDHKQIGKAPVKVALGPGQHLLAAAGGTRRGWAAGTAVKAQPTVTIPTQEVAVKWSKLSRRIAAWHGTVAPVYEIAAVMAEVHTRILLIRHGDVLEAWGRIGAKDEPHRLGSEEGVLGLADTAKVMVMMADRAHAWNDHAPDPDQPLLLETPEERAAHNRRGASDTPTRWWVYATIFGAIAAGALLVYAHDQSNDTQRVELHFP